MGGSLQGANSNLADVLSAPEPSLVVTRTVFAFEGKSSYADAGSFENCSMLLHFSPLSAPYADEIASHSASALLPCALSSTPSATPCSSKDISDLLNTESGILTPPARAGKYQYRSYYKMAYRRTIVLANTAARKRENQPHELDLSTSFEESQQKDILQLSSEQLCEPKSIESQGESASFSHSN
jgi:hypothetical protein